MKINPLHREKAVETGLQFGEAYPRIHDSSADINKAATSDQALQRELNDLASDFGETYFNVNPEDEFTPTQLRVARLYLTELGTITSEAIATALRWRALLGNNGSFPDPGIRYPHLRDPDTRRRVTDEFVAKYSSSDTLVTTRPALSQRRPRPGSAEARYAELWVAEQLGGGVTAATNDRGIDVIGGGYAVQVKNLSGPVGRPVVQNIFGAAHGHGLPAIWSNSGFTAGAVVEARRLQVTLLSF